MSKDIELNISERVAALKLMDEFRGSLSVMAAILDDTKALRILDEEWEKAKRVITAGANGTENWNWNNEGTEKVISLSREGVDYLTTKIKAKDEAGEFTFGDSAIISLKDKLTK